VSHATPDSLATQRKQNAADISPLPMTLSVSKSWKASVIRNKNGVAWNTQGKAADGRRLTPYCTRHVSQGLFPLLHRIDSSHASCLPYTEDVTASQPASQPWVGP
jgi:hypothetical protein